MRKTIISIAAVLACLTSCNFLEVPLESSVSTANYYNTTQEFDMSLTGVYNVLLSANWSDDARYGTYFQGFLLLGRVGTDEMVVRYDNGHGEKALAEYSYTPTNLYVTRPWYMMYKGIQRANVIIDRLTPKNFSDVAEKTRILAEAHFLRAFFYFHLVRLYGEVPLVINEVSDIEALNMKKYPISEVYKQIVSDFTTAQSLPEINAAGRPDKRAAKVMLAKVYLQMAGEPLKDAGAALKAETLLADIVKSGGYELVEDYFSQFDGKHEYNSEYIWDIEFSNNGTTVYGGQVGTTEGVPSPESLYWTMLCSCPEFYNTFDEKDLRRDAIARYKLVYDNDFNIVPEYFTGEGTDYYYYAYKFRHALTAEERGSGWANWANPINFPVTRYADVLLMYAEAGLRAHGTASSQQLECVNMVRRRGFGVPVNKPSVYDLSEVTYDNLLAERSFELCFEGHRWYDLVRFGKLEEAVKKVGKDPVSAESQHQASNFQKKHCFYPVPQDVIDASHGAITQNELWK